MMREESGASAAQVDRQCRQLQSEVAALQERLKRQSADTAGLQALYDQLVDEIRHHRDMLHLDSFDADKSAAIYTAAWRRFMAGEARDYATHRHLNSGSCLPLF